MPAVVGPALAARQPFAVIGPDEHDGVLREAVLFQFAQQSAHLLVVLLNVVVLSRQGLPGLGRVGQVGRHGHIVRLGALFPCGGVLAFLGRPHAAFVGVGEVEHGKERLILFEAVAPVRSVEFSSHALMGGVNW